MTIELTKKIAVLLLKSTSPSHEVMNKIPSDLGYYSTGIYEGWQWRFGIDTPHTAEELHDLYLLCKNKEE